MAGRRSTSRRAATAFGGVPGGGIASGPKNVLQFDISNASSSAVFLIFFLLGLLTRVGSHCTRYGVCNGYDYVPAPPGQAPPCAKPGSTFCESVDHYPRHLIRYLIEKWGYDFNTLLSDESKDDLGDRWSSPPHVYGPVHVPNFAYVSPQPIIQPAISYGPINITVEGGYPDRRYKIEPHFLTNALQQPRPEYNLERTRAPPQTFYQTPVDSLHWWKRYKREDRRDKRQTRLPSGSTTLCPTRSSFIMPRAALNTRGNWMYTVNLNEIDDRYTQLVRSETCVSNSCSGLCTLPNGYSSRCQQQYVQKRLVALEGNGERLYSDVFWFPHCCVCQITPN